MTTIQKKAVLGQTSPIAHLTEADIEQIGIELDAIRQDVLDDRGASGTSGRCSAAPTSPAPSSST